MTPVRNFAHRPGLLTPCDLREHGHFFVNSMLIIL